MGDIQGFRSFVYANYDTTHHAYSSSAVRDSPGRLAQLNAFLRRGLPENRSTRILDFGCGDGTLLRAAEKLHYDNLTGVDAATGMIALASGRTGAELHAEDALSFVRKAPDASYDAIVAFDVIEHLTRPELLDALTEIARVLSPGGRLLLHMPNGASPFHGRIRWGDITHEQAFTAASLNQVLAPLGLRTISVTEDAPVPRGVASRIRRVMWAVLRSVAVLWLAVETGQFRRHILTQNFCLVAEKVAE